MSNIEKWHKFKPLPADIQQRISELPALFAAEDVQLAYLFGSFAAGREAKDIDLALLTPADKPPFLLREAISDCLATQRLDIVDLRRAPPVLKFEIISTGRCLYAADEELPEPDRQLNFEIATLREFKDTIHLRRIQDKLLEERMQERIQSW